MGDAVCRVGVEIIGDIVELHEWIVADRVRIVVSHWASRSVDILRVGHEILAFFNNVTRCSVVPW